MSLPDRCPTWEEMCHVEDLFFASDEWVVQYHPPRKHNINCHRFTLHLWRPQETGVPKPPWWMIGPRKPGPEGLREARDAAEAYLRARGE